MINQHQFNINKSWIEVCESLSVGQPCCAVHNASCATPVSQRLFENLSVIRLWSSPGFQRVLSAAWAVFEQCKLLSVCGVSYQMLFHQMEFRGQLLQMTLCRNQYLKHDYIAISDKTRCYLHQKKLLCFFICSCCLILEMVSFTNVLFASPNGLRKKRLLISPYWLTADNVFTHMQVQKGGHGSMKFSTADFLSDFVEPHGQQVQSGECYHYVDHTDNVGLLGYSKDTYVFASIPLSDLLTQVTVAQAHAIIKCHNISCGARDSMPAIQSRLEHHSGLCCTINKSVFIKSLMKPKSPVERMRTQRAKHGMKSCTLSNHSSEPSADFPPAPLDKSLSNIIIEKACS